MHGPLGCQKCGEEEIKAKGEHKVIWCQKEERPRWSEGEVGTPGEWTSWEDVQKGAKSKDIGPGVETFFENIGG